MPQKLRAFVAQGQDLGHKGQVVAGLAARALPRSAQGPGPEGGLAQGPVAGMFKEGHDQRAVQRDDLPRHSPFSGGGPHRGQQPVGQPVQPVPRNGQHIIALIRQHVLRELRGQDGQAGADLGHAGARRIRQARAGPVQIAQHQPHQARILGRQVIGALGHGLDARMKARVHADAAAVIGQPRREVALQRLPGGVRIDGGQRVEDRQHPVQPFIGLFHRGDGVGEIGGGGIRRDRLDLRQRGGQFSVEGRGEILVRDQVEAGQPFGAGPAGQFGIGGRLHRAASCRSDRD